MVIPLNGSSLVRGLGFVSRDRVAAVVGDGNTFVFLGFALEDAGGIDDDDDDIFWDGVDVEVGDDDDVFLDNGDVEVDDDGDVFLDNVDVEVDAGIVGNFFFPVLLVLVFSSRAEIFFWSLRLSALSKFTNSTLDATVSSISEQYFSMVSRSLCTLR